MEIIACNKNKQCIYYMQLERYKQMYTELEKSYNELFQSKIKNNAEVDNYFNQ